MLRIPSTAAAALFMISGASAADLAARSTAFDALIAHHAKLHGVPESLVHRTVMRESGYNPGLIHRHCYGLMQIKYGTARSMGYNGPERGLLDPQINLTYAIPYLANAYRLADGNEDRATSLYRGGYYYLAKHKKMLGALRTASASPVTPEPAAPAPVPQPPRNPLAGLVALFAGPPETNAANGSQAPGE